MRKVLLCLAVGALFAAPSLAVTTLEFAAGPGGGWNYNGAGLLTFQQNYAVTKGLLSTSDALVGALVHIPDLTVGNLPGGPYTLTPNSASITITNVANTLTYLTGTLGLGNLVASGTTGDAYNLFLADITGITVNNGTLGSAALAEIAAMPVPQLDFELSLQGVSETWQVMLQSGHQGNDGFSGAMTVFPPPVAVPVPGAILLVGMGTLLVGRLRRSRTLYR